jgi:hypothetical protein
MLSDFPPNLYRAELVNPEICRGLQLPNVVKARSATRESNILRHRGNVVQVRCRTTAMFRQAPLPFQVESRLRCAVGGARRICYSRRTDEFAR